MITQPTSACTKGVDLTETAKERLVTILARRYANHTTTEQDLYQEGRLALMKAEQTFRPETGAKFEGYAYRVIENRFRDILRKRGTKCASNTAVLNPDTQKHEYDLDTEMDLLEIKKILHDHVSDLERAVFNSYYMEGFSYDEISKIFELPYKKIDNVVQKVKRKIKEHL